MDLHFKYIEANDLDIMMPFYGLRKNRTCDSVFLESFIWKEFYKVRYAIWEEKALLWLMEYEGNCFSAMPLCREEDLPDAFRALEQYFNEVLQVPLVINLADEYAVQYLNLPETEYLIKEQVDSKDYLYLGESLRKLSGKKLHKKKNHLNSFVRNYGEKAEYRPLCCSDSHLVWLFLDKWSLTKGDAVEEHLEYEVKGIHDILKNCSNLNIRMGGVFIDGELEAFTMGSYNALEDMAIIHIEKANPEIRGLYQFINQQFLLWEFPDVEWVNREDDLGLEGLRTAKMSYCPADFARKYLVQQIVDGKGDYEWTSEIGNTMAGEEIVALTELEAGETRGLWQEAFPEDSESFVDYYYSEKVKDNRIYVKKENGFLLAMAQLNPYELSMKEQVREIPYIVGVATDAGRRHEGHMRDLLKRMAQDLNGAQIPFTFLMPAAKEIYLPFSFSYMSDMDSFTLKDTAEGLLRRIACESTDEDLQKAADYMEMWLSARYEMYCKRDAAYAERLIKELKSEDGQLYFLYDGEALVGVQAFWGIEKKEQRLLYAEDSYVEKRDKGPRIMARIICLSQLLSEFRLKEDAKEEEITICLQVRDELLEENNGHFKWTLTKETSSVKQLSAHASEEDMSLAAASVAARPYMVVEGMEAALQMEIGDLASWLFGGQELKAIWPELGEEGERGLLLVDTVKHIFIDEIV